MSSMEPRVTANRRDFCKTAGAAALTTSLFTGNIKGASDKITVGYIGMGRMGMANLSISMKNPAIQPVAVCDVYQPHLEKAEALARRDGHQAKGYRDFREILADKSIDVVCISTPEHWHPYMTVEACKAGKDVYVEKPLCVYVEEGQKMVEAARKYKRVVQAGTMQRSGVHFQKAVEIVKSGELGDITFCRTWQAGLTKQEGWGNPPDSEPPAGLDWDMWLGPAPKRPFNANRWGVRPDAFSTFRYFWDYAGGAMTDWGVHLIDITQWAFDEVMPKSVDAMGSKFYVKDNVETPDTMLVTYMYPDFIGSYESRTANPMPMHANERYGTSFHGTKGTLIVNRGGYEVFLTGERGEQSRGDHTRQQMNEPHWQNFVECIRSRQKPISDIETCYRTSATCILSNLAMRLKMRLDWDDSKQTVLQDAAKPYLKAKYRAPWKLEV